MGRAGRFGTEPSRTCRPLRAPQGVGSDQSLAAGARHLPPSLRLLRLVLSMSSLGHGPRARCEKTGLLLVRSGWKASPHGAGGKRARRRGARTAGAAAGAPLPARARQEFPPPPPGGAPGACGVSAPPGTCGIRAHRSVCVYHVETGGKGLKEYGLHRHRRGPGAGAPSGPREAEGIAGRAPPGLLRRPGKATEGCSFPPPLKPASGSSGGGLKSRQAW